MDDTISVQTSTQSRVGDDWCQQQLLKRVNFLSGSFVNGSPGGEPFTHVKEKSGLATRDYRCARHVKTSYNLKRLSTYRTLINNIRAAKVIQLIVRAVPTQ